MTLYHMEKLSKLVSFSLTRPVTKYVDEKKLPHVLFHGPPGTGKTSTMLAIAKKMYGPHYKNNILELNASDDRGIDVVRNKIKEFCKTQQIMTRGIKLVILDECDAVTSAAQFALRRVIEKYTKTTRFCLICNYVQKIIPALQSRCTRFRFAPLESEHVSAKLRDIAIGEKIELDDDAREAVVKLSGGDMRKVLNILESASMAHDGKISIDDVYNCTGRPNPKEVATMLQSLLEDSYLDSFNKVKDIKVGRSLTLEDIVRDLHLEVMGTGLPQLHKIFIIQRLAEIEIRISLGCNERLQIASLVGCFQEVRHMRKD